MTLGNIVKQYRADNDLSMDEFARRCSLSKGYISMIENGINPRNNKPIAPTLPSIMKIATAMNTDLEELLKIMDGNQKVTLSHQRKPEKKKSVIINVLGRVAAGIPIDASENIIDTEEITQEMAQTGTFFGLQIHGDSMEPKMSEGDVVIVRQQDDAESGEIVIVTVNGTDATCKRLRKYRDGIELISSNPSYKPIFFSNEEIIKKPVKIIGRVIELRAKF